MSGENEDATESWGTAASAIGVTLFLLTLLTLVVFGWAAVITGTLWLVVVATAVGALSLAALATDKRDVEARNYWMASGACVTVGILAWLCIPAGTPESESHRYWSQLRDICLQLKTLEKTIDDAEPSQAPDQYYALMREASEAFRKSSEDISRLSVDGVDTEIVEYAADMGFQLSESSAVISSATRLAEETTALGEYASSASAAVEAFARGLFGDPFGKHTEINAASAQLQSRWVQLRARADQIQARGHELEAREMPLRARLTERYGGRFPSLYDAGGATAPDEADDAVQQESDVAADAPIPHPAVMVFGFIYNWFGIPGVILAVVLIIHAIRSSESTEEKLHPGSNASVSASELSSYGMSLFRLLGHLAKSDGAVVKAEIKAVEECMDALNLNATQRDQAIEQFREGKRVRDPAQLIEALASAAQGNAEIKEETLQVVVAIAAADGNVSEREEAVIRSLHFAMMPINIAIEDVLRYLRESSPYYVLGITPPADAAAIKKAYRAKCREFHPDHLKSRKLPPEMEAFAAERMRKIQEAYETLIAQA